MGYQSQSWPNIYLRYGQAWHSTLGMIYLSKKGAGMLQYIYIAYVAVLANSGPLCRYDWGPPTDRTQGPTENGLHPSLHVLLSTLACVVLEPHEFVHFAKKSTAVARSSSTDHFKALCVLSSQHGVLLSDLTPVRKS
uniref:Uncharacterized protein n=1 Tax=Pyxicephalus adspersus TaxID=30357 RepID=A0AAV3B3S4_PYXAD|nr:TPA: hypothetical protein GDO54_007697 [Pyxicephalus adspersus]